MISVIIPSYNRKDDLRECLKSVISQDYQSKEIIVIDDGSKDNSGEMVEKEFPQVKLIKNFKTIGACKSRNIAIRLSKGSYIWFLDNDSLAVDSKLLSRMVERMKDNIGCIGGEGDFQNMKMRVEFIGLTGRNITKNYDFENEIESDYITTANCLIKKENLIKAGGFDETYGYLTEDADLGLKIRRLGLKNIVSKDTLIFHKFSFKSRFGNFYLLHRNRIYFIFRNFFLRALFLPIFDFFVFFDFRNYLKIKNYNLENSLILVNADRDKKCSLLDRVFLLGSKYMLGLILGYLWNFFYLPLTTYYKIKKKRFL